MVSLRSLELEPRADLERRRVHSTRLLEREGVMDNIGWSPEFPMGCLGHDFDYLGSIGLDSKRRTMRVPQSGGGGCAVALLPSRRRIPKREPRKERA